MQRWQFANGSRAGIRVSLGRRNLRIRVRRNDLSNDNPDVDAVQVTGIVANVRNGVSEWTEDLVMEGNAVDFRSNDTRDGLHISARNGRGVRVAANTIRGGSRGLRVESCSDLDLDRNKVYGATSHACTIGAVDNDIIDVRARGNLFQTAAEFKAAVALTGAHALTRSSIEERNRLEATAQGYSVMSTDGGARSFRYKSNSVNCPLHSSAVPTEDAGNVTE